MGAAIGAGVGKRVVQALQSPYFRTVVSAPLKNKLAEALASGSAGRIESALHPITKVLKALPSQASQAVQ